MPAGRPPKLTPKLRLELLDRLMLGESVREIAADPHMPHEANVYRLLVRDAEFRELYRVAREAQMDRFGEEIVEIADDGSNDWMERAGRRGEIVDLPDHEHISRSKLRVETRMWLMGRLAPRKYGTKVEQIHSGGDKPLQVEDVSARDRIEAKLIGLAARLPPGE